MIFLGHPKVHANCLCVADVQISVGFWRKARLNATAVFTGSQIIFNQLFYETDAFLLVVIFCFYRHNVVCIVLLQGAKINERRGKAKENAIFLASRPSGLHKSSVLFMASCGRMSCRELPTGSS